MLQGKKSYSLTSYSLVSKMTSLIFSYFSSTTGIKVKRNKQILSSQVLNWPWLLKHLTTSKYSQHLKIQIFLRSYLYVKLLNLKDGKHFRDPAVRLSWGTGVPFTTHVIGIALEEHRLWTQVNLDSANESTAVVARWLWTIFLSSLSFDFLIN